jgi:uncharacterized protein (TIGR02466 family)
MWVNIMPPGVVHSMHLHPLSVISGTYYVKTPANCSVLKFEDPRLSSLMAAPPKKAKARIENKNFSKFGRNPTEIPVIDSKRSSQ